MVRTDEFEPPDFSVKLVSEKEVVYDEEVLADRLRLQASEPRLVTVIVAAPDEVALTIRVVGLLAIEKSCTSIVIVPCLRETIWEPTIPFSWA